MKRLLSICSFSALAIPATQAQTWYLEQTFGNNGTVHVAPGPGDFHARAHALSPDGKLLVAGSAYDFGPNSFHAGFIKLDTVCGALDPSFGDSGKVAVTFEQRTVLHDMAVQPDGRIIGAGLIAENNFGSQQWPGLYRLNPDGSIDTSFNHTGYHKLSINGGGEFGRCLIGNDGRITCTGASFVQGLMAARFMPDGSLDTTYGSGGISALPLQNAPLTSKQTGVMTADSSVISISMAWPGTGSAYWLALGKFGPDGEPDTTFGVGGVSFGAFTNDWNGTSEGNLGASVMPDGRILVSGMGASPEEGFLMVRFTPDGAVDSTYGTNGVSLVMDMPYYSTGKHYLRPDGSTLQFGGSLNVIEGLCLARDVNGAVIPAFGSNGTAAASTGLNFEYFIGGFQRPDGAIIGYGTQYSSSMMLVARLRDTPHPLPEITLNGSELTTTGMGPFQWQLDGVDIPGATGDTWTPTASGVYTVVMTLSSDCIFTSSQFTVTGIPVEILRGIAVLGNPVDDVLQVRSPTGGVAFDLFDAAGRKLADGRLHAGINRIDMRAAAEGIYFLHVTKAGERRVERITVL